MKKDIKKTKAVVTHDSKARTVIKESSMLYSITSGKWPQAADT